jgi:hypothetical protein
MRISDTARTLRRLASLCVEVARLPRARLHFDTRRAPDAIRATHALFTKPHPRYRMIKNKSIGIALIHLRHFKTAADYLATVKKRDYAAYHGKRAKARGYVFREIERNDFIDDIHAINISSDQRQGRPMDGSYREKQLHYQALPHFRYTGIVDRDEKLVAYCNYGVYGNFAATDQLLGYLNSDGVMHLLLLEIVCQLIEERKLDYFMYDTYLGARPGLRSFKHRLGFAPYRVRYSIG